MRGLALFLLPALSIHAADPLYDAIRRDDCPALKRQLASATGPALNTRDTHGLTPLMYAVAYASPACLTALLDKGADVNGQSNSGATALFFALHDLAKTRLLVERGAQVAVKDKQGTTPFSLAVVLPHGAAVSAYLIEHGADAKEEGPQGNLLARAAYLQRDPELAELARRSGVASAKLTGLTYFGLPRTAAAATELVRAGYDLNTPVRLVNLRFPSLGGLANEGDADSVRIFLEGGAKPNEAANNGLTPLMMAVAAYAPNPDIVRALLAKGANVNAADRSGRTALDWARLQGESDIVKLLLDAGAKPGAPPPPAPAPIATPRNARSAIAAAVERLRPIGPNFFSKTKCISCHNQSLPSMAFRAAVSRGIELDEAVLRHATQATYEQWMPSVETVLQGRRTIGGFVANISYAMLQMRGEGHPADPVTDAVAQGLLHNQRLDGSWHIPDTRPPIGPSPIKWTALVLFSINAYAPPAARQRTEAATAHGLAYLRRSTPADTQDAAFVMLGLHWSRVPKAEAAAAAKRLLTLQKPDGGWSQTPTMASDAYATGQVLWALHETGQLKPRDAAYHRGAAFLLRNQLEDGSWYVRSRGIAFQPYFESGFPHGADQFISAAATSWAVLALSPTLPAR